MVRFIALCLAVFFTDLAVDAGISNVGSPAFLAALAVMFGLGAVYPRDCKNHRD